MADEDDAALRAQEAELDAAKARIDSVVDRLRERGIPPYAADERIAIAWPKTWRTGGS